MALLEEQDALARRIGAVVTRFDGQPVMRRLGIRIHELGTDQRDELKQFRILQRACRESAELKQALMDEGLPDLTTLPIISPETGRLVQAWNHWIELNEAD